MTRSQTRALSIALVIAAVALPATGVVHFSWVCCAGALIAIASAVVLARRGHLLRALGVFSMSLALLAMTSGAAVPVAVLGHPVRRTAVVYGLLLVGSLLVLPDVLGRQPRS